MDQLLLDVRRRLDEDDVPAAVPVEAWLAAADGTSHA
jgi:hypothetical protein